MAGEGPGLRSFVTAPVLLAAGVIEYLGGPSIDPRFCLGAAGAAWQLDPA